MDILDTSHAVQLIIALLGGIAFLIAVLSGYGRQLFLVIIVMIPFQPLDSKYGSANMVLVYALGVATLLYGGRGSGRGKTKPPLLGAFAFLLFVYFISWSQAPRLFWGKHLTYLITLLSDVVLFYLTYTFVQKQKDIEVIFKALFISNVLVIGYCMIQLAVGYGHEAVFGIEEFSIQQNRLDQRLVGPFEAVGITAEYLVIQSMLLGFYIMKKGKWRAASMALLFMNAAVLVGTGNRGGFISAILACILFVYVFRKQLGKKGIVTAVVSFSVILASASIVMITFTDFNVLYKRLLGTEIEGVTPDSRSGWSYVVEKIADKPVLGHGARIVTPFEYTKPPRDWPKDIVDFYPHSLYLYILYTMGALGFIAYSVWAIGYWKILCAAKKLHPPPDSILSGMPELAMIIFVIFLFDQFKVEFLRYYLLDYQHYIATLFGTFAAYRKAVVTGKGTRQKGREEELQKPGAMRLLRSRGG